MFELILFLELSGKKFNSLEGKENKHHVCQSSFYPFDFIRSNRYKEEHEHAFCLLSKKKKTHTHKRTRMEFFVFISLHISSYIYLVFLDVKRAFDQLSNPPFLFFLPSVPFSRYIIFFLCSFKYHPLQRCHPININKFRRKYSMIYAGN